ncbi:putative LigA [Nocardioidaceae bacterium Broad-1]|nr:putative LigA [Nocardioidaceae bacterium Broad-1]
MRSQAPVLAPLFRSEAQALLLSELLLPGEELSMTDLAERVGLPYPTVHREVARLLDAGLLTDRRVGRTRLVKVQPAEPAARADAGDPADRDRPGRAAPGGPRGSRRDRARPSSSGPSRPERRGSRARRPNDIDLMVIGTPDVRAVYEVCREVSDSVGRIVNPTIMSPEEAEEQTGFLEEVRASPVIEIYGGGPDGPAADPGTAEDG